MRGIIGVIDGSPVGIEQDTDVADRRSLLQPVAPVLKQAPEPSR
jgi:adenosine/AMP kinase